MAWQYRQASGWLLNPTGELEAVGYSGAEPSGKNSPSMQDVHNYGPIPEGFYTFGQAVDSPKHGPLAIPLIPDATNVMFGRSGFLCHGDSREAPGTASEGCIIMPRVVREDLIASPDQRLQVVSGEETT